MTEDPDQGAREWALAQFGGGDDTPIELMSSEDPEWIQDEEYILWDCDCDCDCDCDGEEEENRPSMDLAVQIQMAAGLQFGDYGRGYVFLCSACGGGKFLSQST